MNVDALTHAVVYNWLPPRDDIIAMVLPHFMTAYPIQSEAMLSILKFLNPILCACILKCSNIIVTNSFFLTFSPFLFNWSTSLPSEKLQSLQKSLNLSKYTICTSSTGGQGGVRGGCPPYRSRFYDPPPTFSKIY